MTSSCFCSAFPSERLPGIPGNYCFLALTSWIRKNPKERTIIAPTELRADVKLEKTNLVARMFADWEEIPIRLLEQMDLRNSLYGYIGKEDYTMFPIIRPASFGPD